MDTDLLSDTQELPLQVDRATDQRLQLFIEGLVRQQDKSYATFTFPVQEIEPLMLLQESWNEQQFRYYWEKPSDNFAIAAGDTLVQLSASGPSRFADIISQQQALQNATASFSSVYHSRAGLMFLGGFSFFSRLETADWDSFEAASLTVPRWFILKDGDHYSATLSLQLPDFQSRNEIYEEVTGRLRSLNRQMTSASDSPSSPVIARKNTDPFPAIPLKLGFEAWISSVKQAKKQIRQETFDKIVLARRLSVARKNTAPVTKLLDHLRRRYENCSCFLVHPPGGQSFVGATPEQLIAFEDNLLQTEALAGSIERGKTAMEDLTLAKDLSISTKNRNEHQFVVQDIEQRLRPFARSIRHSSQPQVKKLSNVQHLYTPIQADLKPEATVLSVLEKLHPTPAVGGYPWHKAAPYIRELEDFERGWYAGPVGWVDASGSGEFAVAIRSGLIGEEQVHFFAGCGIVEDSDPQTEWEETNLKLKPMLSALQYD
ncbi:isochorismate synthase [Fodinibius sediminis]|uniref:isochorismate synthase n=1 Tax=Fodinibius sediminis TaxID=1214077 RepID=A0A521B7L0_9BACT|nr:isochorismate synthase [Fodinibius sediminis]SMO43079.1 isochorismate synthase [Fodinibius sediminis]